MAIYSPEALREEKRRELQRRAILQPRGGFKNFIRLAWEHIEPLPFVGGWHIDLMCSHAEAVTRREIKRLLVKQPPGTSKSRIWSVLYPLWDWLFVPHRRFMFATFDESLSYRDSEACRNLLTSEWFRQLFGDLCGHERGTCTHPQVIHTRHSAKDKSDTLGVWWNNQGGLRFSTTIESKGTGWHCHTQVIDDPLKPQDVLSGATDAKNALNRVSTWYSGTMATRRAEPVQDFARIVVMQRLHDNDLIGQLEREGGYVVINLPMEFIPEKRCATPWGIDPRTEPGELLCEERFNAADVAQLKKDMGPWIYAAQAQQDPVPPKGSLILEDWIQYTDETPESLITKGAHAIQSWDCAFEKSLESDRVAGHLWFWLPANNCFYLMDVNCSVMSFNETIGAVEQFTFIHPEAFDKLVEKKANGPAIVSQLGNLTGGFLLVDPLGSKPARVVAVTPTFAAKRVFVRADQTWTDEVVKEWTRFPKYQFDDNTDAMTQALGFWLKDDPSWLKIMGALFSYYRSVDGVVTPQPFQQTAQSILSHFR